MPDSHPVTSRRMARLQHLYPSCSSSRRRWFVFSCIVYCLVFVKGDNTAKDKLINGIKSDPAMEVATTVTKTVLKRAVVPELKKHSATIAKGIAISLFAAQGLAYVGVIGEQGEGLWETAEDNETVRKFLRYVGFKPGGLARKQFESMLRGFNNMKPKAKFISSISIGITSFLALLQLSVGLATSILVTYIVAEVLSYMGVIGRVGEGLDEWMEQEGKHVVRNARIMADEARVKLRNWLKPGGLLKKTLLQLKEDKVFWTGFSIGSVAGIVLDQK